MEISNGKLQHIAQALIALQNYEFFSIPAHRIKVAVRVLSPHTTSLDEGIGGLAEKYGNKIGEGRFTFEGDSLASFNEAVKPLLDEKFEFPKLKGITWDDIKLANAKISAIGAQALEDCGFLTGEPEPSEQAIHPPVPAETARV